MKKYAPFLVGGLAGCFVVAAFAICGITFGTAFALGVVFGNVSVYLAVRSL